MPKVYRYTILAAFVGLVCTPLWFIVHYQSLIVSHKEWYQPYRSAPDKIPDLESSITPRSKAEALKERRPCDKPRGKEESELCAEWKAALAGEEAALWAARGFYLSLASLALSGFGLVALLITIRQGRTGLRSARKANKISRQTHVAETRPWIAIENVEATVTLAEWDNMPAFRVGIKFKATNYGVSPAVKVFGHPEFLRYDFFGKEQESVRALHVKLQSDYEFGEVIYPNHHSFIEREGYVTLEDSDERYGVILAVVVGVRYTMPSYKKWFYTGRMYLVAGQVPTSPTMKIGINPRCIGLTKISPEERGDFII
ncbi:hypothetical protein U1872_18125 [Sphingomonas sp. RB3P16]|uniref:hypothetical protein n=1 Tax=Parasphingomonas frigoris TaxID=3096163 RepID=UPI002FC8E968